MTNKILELLGLVKIKDIRDLKKQPYTADELDSMYVEVAFSRAEGWDKDKYQTMLDLLKKNREFAQFLDVMVTDDVKRAYSVPDAERLAVRGAVSRTRYLRSLCLNQDETKRVMSNKVTRYAR